MPAEAPLLDSDLEIREALPDDAHAIAALAREPIPASVLRAYNLEKLEFGRSYLIPKPLDPRLLCTIAPAVARAAVESGVARRPVADWDAYAERLRTLAE